MASNGRGEWDDAFKETTPHSNKDKISGSNHTIGIGLDATETIKSLPTGEWDDAFMKNERPNKHSPEVVEIINKIAAIDHALPDNSPVKPVLLSTLATGLLYFGEFLEAEKQCLRFLRLAERLTGSDSESTLTCLGNLAAVYDYVGDYERAIDLTEKSRTICENNKEFHKERYHILTASLAKRQLKCMMIESALSNSERALAAARVRYSETRDFGDLSMALSARAACALSVGNYNEAEALLNESIRLIDLEYQKMSGALESSETAAYCDNLYNLYELYILQAKYAEATAIEPKLVEIFKKEFRDFSTLDLARLNASRSILYHETGKMDKAKSYANQFLSYQRENLPTVLGMAESQRIGWQSDNLDFTIPIAFCTPSEVADYILEWKGVVLDSLIRDRAMLKMNSSDKSEVDFKELLHLRQQIARRQLLQASGPKSKDADYALIKNRIYSLEKDLVRKSNGSSGSLPNISITHSSLRNILNDKTALIEFVTYRKLPDRRFGKQLFGAIVLTGSSAPQWIPLTSLTAATQGVLREYLNDVVMPDATNENISSLLASLYESIWAPVERSLPKSVNTLIISPDSFLNFVPFACILSPEDKFLSEEYEIVYVGSGRDLTFSPAKESNKQLSVFANPRFDRSISATTKQFAMRSAEIAEFGRIRLPQLPGTEVEGRSLLDEAKSSGWTTASYFGDSATEKQLRAIKKPGILHLATHGFYLNSFSPTQDGTRGMQVVGLEQDQPQASNGKGVDPMRASGIALTGAQATLKAWSEGKAPDPDNDGILTAEEVAGLDLDGTWLVTLSACETGVGKVKSGEGVFGLRRAFMMAGAQNLLMTLWPVSDETTADIMKDFYHRALATGDAPKALAETQRDWLVKLRKEKGLLAAVRDAGPFIMTTMGALPTNATFSASKQKEFLK